MAYTIKVNDEDHTADVGSKIGGSARSFHRRQSSTNMPDADSPKERVDSGDVGLALLGFASGSMDALAFFNLGEVFPSAMTGNTALLGLALLPFVAVFGAAGFHWRAQQDRGGA